MVRVRATPKGPDLCGAPDESVKTIEIKVLKYMSLLYGWARYPVCTQNDARWLAG